MLAGPVRDGHSYGNCMQLFTIQTYSDLGGNHVLAPHGLKLPLPVHTNSLFMAMCTSETVGWAVIGLYES